MKTNELAQTVNAVVNPGVVLPVLAAASWLAVQHAAVAVAVAVVAVVNAVAVAVAAAVAAAHWALPVNLTTLAPVPVALPVALPVLDTLSVVDPEQTFADAYDATMRPAGPPIDDEPGAPLFIVEFETADIPNADLAADPTADLAGAEWAESDDPTAIVAAIEPAIWADADMPSYGWQPDELADAKSTAVAAMLAGTSPAIAAKMAGVSLSTAKRWRSAAKLAAAKLAV